MTTTTLFTPGQNGYGVVLPNARQTSQNGPQSRFSIEVGKTAAVVQATWVTDDAGFKYHRSFYRLQGKGAIPFNVNLIIDTHNVVPYVAYYIPGTWELVSMSGLTYTIRAQLEVVRQ